MVEEAPRCLRSRRSPRRRRGPRDRVSQPNPSEYTPVLVERRDHRQADLACRARSPRCRSPGRCGRCRCPRPRRPRPRRRRGARSPPPRTLPGPPAARRTGRVPPARQLRPGSLLHDLERTAERLLEGPLGQPELVLALADLDVPQVSAHGGGHVGGQRPGGRRPDQQRLAWPVHEREADGEPRVLAVLVALVHLHLGQPGPAARAPRHGVVALVDPAAPVALREEAPDDVVVLVAEREVGAARVRHASVRPPSPRRRSLGRRALDVACWVGSSLSRSRTHELRRVVPVHPVAEPDRLLRLACGERAAPAPCTRSRTRRCRTPRCRAWS